MNSVNQDVEQHLENTENNSQVYPKPYPLHRAPSEKTTSVPQTECVMDPTPAPKKRCRRSDAAIEEEYQEFLRLVQEGKSRPIIMRALNLTAQQFARHVIKGFQCGTLTHLPDDDAIFSATAFPAKIRQELGAGKTDLIQATYDNGRVTLALLPA